MKNDNPETNVLLCDCGKTLHSSLDFDKLQNNLKQLPQVNTVELTSGLCRQNDCQKALKSLEKKQTKRLVIGACDREIFDESLREVMSSQKTLNEGLLWCVNIREHCAWAARNSKDADSKAIDVLTAAVRRTIHAAPVQSKKFKANQNVLVLGADMAALQTANAISQLGHKVTIVEKTDKLGGFTTRNPRLYSYVAEDYIEAESIVRNRADKLIAQVNNNKQISVLTETDVKSINGRLGSFSVSLASNGKGKNLTAGVIVLSADAADTNTDLTQLIQFKSGIPKRIAIVADILSQHDRNVSAQILSAAEMLAKRFAAEVKLYCSSIRVSAAGLEKLYRRARQAGVVIVKYDSPPKIEEIGTKKILRLQEPIIGKEISEEFDMVINADAPASDKNNEILNQIQGLRPGPQGTLQYDSVWLLPTKTNLQGVFVVGPARNNTELRDAQNDGLAAANRIHELLKNKQLEILDDAAQVDADKCVLCLTCMRICPEHAISIDLDNKVAAVSELTCRRCGICAAQCPAAAIQLPRYTDLQIAADIGLDSKSKNPKPKTVVFACENSAYPAATAAATNGLLWKQPIRLIRVPCAGKVDARDVLKALESGAQKVIILACHLENCQYLDGSTRADSRIKQLNNALEKAGIDKKQVLFKQLASVEPSKFLDCIKE